MKSIKIDKIDIIIKDKVPKESVDIDNINMDIINIYKGYILKPLLFIFNISIEVIFPGSIKLALIKPIYKNKDNNLISNYRSISILPQIFEIIIYNRL